MVLGSQNQHLLFIVQLTVSLISHVHGSDQISINMADLDLAAFRGEVKTYKEIKSIPAGLKGR